MTISSVSLSSPPLISISKPNPRHSLKTTKSSLRLISSFEFAAVVYSRRAISCRIPQEKTRIWRISAAASEDALPSDASGIENTQQMISTDEGGVSNIISVLLFVAFVGLSVLTIGVIYIAVTDFLQKREREKFEKELAAEKKKKSGKKGQVRAKTGPRGFGQKIDEYDD